MTIRRAIAAALLMALAIALSGAPTFAASGTTRMVDADGHASAAGCNSSGFAFKKIQKAIDASSSGDTVLVCPGTYEEQVAAIGLSNFTLKSTSPWAATIKTPSVLDADYLVGLGAGSNITFQGFTLEVRAGDGSNCQQLGEAILIAETIGSQVRGNRIRATGGLTLGPCGYFIGIQVGFSSPFAPTAARHAGFPPAARVPAPTPSRATIDYNAVRDFIGAGITVGGVGSRSLVTRNSVRFFHLKADTTDCSVIPPFSGVPSAGLPRSAVRSAAARIVSALRAAAPGGEVCAAFGIAQGDGASGDIVNNRVLSGPDSGLGAPVSTAEPAPATPAMFVGILQFIPGTGVGRTGMADNEVFRTVVGIGGIGPDNTTIRANVLHDNILGIYLDETVGATVKDNIAHNNAVGIGINDDFLDVLQLLSHDNTFTGNQVSGNYINSCFDNTTGGTGTLGTSDTWTGNTAEDNSSDPLGICGVID
jgi:parallel beta-helix repeat protein